MVNNPIGYIDPSGHGVDCGIADSNFDRTNDLQNWAHYQSNTNNNRSSYEYGSSDDNDNNSEKKLPKNATIHSIGTPDELPFGFYRGVNFTIGDLHGITGIFTGLFYSGSIDMVYYHGKVALFYSEFVPHPAINSTLPIYHEGFLAEPRGNIFQKIPHLVWGENQASNPQISLNRDGGVLWGKGLERSGVYAYNGSSTHYGGSILCCGGE